MSHAYLIEIDHSTVAMIVRESEGYRFYATKPSLSWLQAQMFDTADQAHHAALEIHGRSCLTKSCLTPLHSHGAFETVQSSLPVSKINTNASSQSQSTDKVCDALSRHYQDVGISAVVAALNAIAEASRSKNSLETRETRIGASRLMHSDDVAA